MPFCSRHTCSSYVREKSSPECRGNRSWSFAPRLKDATRAFVCSRHNSSSPVSRDHSAIQSALRDHSKASLQPVSLLRDRLSLRWSVFDSRSRCTPFLALFRGDGGWLFGSSQSSLGMITITMWKRLRQEEEGEVLKLVKLARSFTLCYTSSHD